MNFQKVIYCITWEQDILFEVLNKQICKKSFFILEFNFVSKALMFPRIKIL